MENNLAPNVETFIGLAFLIIVLAIWELIWKGFAMWKAARNGKSGWFIALLIINSVGILPILYIYVFSKKDTPTSEAR